MYLKLARLVQRTIAHRPYRLDVAVRNRAMVAAHRRGINHNTITDAIGLSGQQVRTVLNEGRQRGCKPDPQTEQSDGIDTDSTV